MIDVSWNANGGQALGTFQADDAGGSWQGIAVPFPLISTDAYTVTIVGESSGITLTTPLQIVPGLFQRSRQWDRYGISRLEKPYS